MQSHLFTHSSTSTHLITHSLDRMIDWSIDSLIVKLIVWVISCHFVSSQYIQILLYKLSRVLENVFLLNKNRKNVAENCDEPVRIMTASFGRKTMLLPQVLYAVLKRFILEIDHNMQKTCEIVSPKFILWAIFRDEFRCPNQCLVAFGDCATGCFQHWYAILKKTGSNSTSNIVTNPNRSLPLSVLSFISNATFYKIVHLQHA